MVEPWRRQSGLGHLGLRADAGRGPSNAAVTLTALPAPTLLILRGDPAAAGFAEAVEAALGLALPPQPNRTAATDGRKLLWLGPTEWLLVLTDGGTDAAAALRAAFADGSGALVEVTAAREVLSVAGPQAREVLARGCGLDLHPRVFALGDCAQTLLGQLDVLLHLVDDTPTFELYVGRSFADHLWRWLEQAAQPYGFATRA